jgi:E3 ubiquitin-protein ligase Mdm2
MGCRIILCTYICIQQCCEVTVLIISFFVAWFLQDKWTCPNCAMPNWPLHRFCDFCWTLRPDWLPAPRRTLDKLTASCPESQTAVVEAADSFSVAAGNTGSYSSVSTSSSAFAEHNAVTSNNGIDNRTLLETDALSLSSSVPAAATNTCMICISAPKNASIIHGSSGHQACCLRCAKRLKSRHLPCPVCRRPINRVIRNYVV